MDIRKTTMVERMQMRLIRRGGETLVDGNFWLLTQHLDAPRFVGLKFLARNYGEAERKFSVATENEMARQEAVALGAA